MFLSLLAVKYLRNEATGVTLIFLRPGFIRGTSRFPKKFDPRSRPDSSQHSGQQLPSAQNVDDDVINDDLVVVILARRSEPRPVVVEAQAPTVGAGPLPQPRQSIFRSELPKVVRRNQKLFHRKDESFRQLRRLESIVVCSGCIDSVDNNDADVDFESRSTSADAAEQQLSRFAKF